MSAEDYTKGMKYEMLVRNAFDCPSGMRNGAHQSFMQNAITMERGETFPKHLGSFEKQFNKVKTYTSKALLKLSKKKPYSKESDYFIELNDRLDFIKTTSELMKIVDFGMDKVIELRSS